MTVAGLVLAGGRSSRFGSDKALAELGGARLLDRAIAALRPLAASVAVSATDTGPVADAARACGCPVLCDSAGLPHGPLAGILAGLRWGKALGATWVLSLPCDVVAVPTGAYVRLLAAAPDGGAYAVTADGAQGLCAAWPVDRIQLLEAALADGAHPPVRQVLEQLGATPVQFDGGWHNINTREDLRAAEQALQGRTRSG